MKARFYCVFLFLMALVDGTIVFLFPVDYQYISISFVPHLCIAALFLSVWKRGYMDRMLMGFLFGILYDSFFLNCFSFHIIRLTSSKHTLEIRGSTLGIIYGISPVEAVFLPSNFVVVQNRMPTQKLCHRYEMKYFGKLQ